MPSTAADPGVEVAVGILRDARGRVLLTRRPAGKPLAGLWEFPGGKLAAGESPPDALRRELREELGIETRSLRPFMRLRHDYSAAPGTSKNAVLEPPARVLLHAFAITRWRGRAMGREGQPLKWVAPAALAGTPMPAANTALQNALRLPALYQISGDCEPGQETAFLARLAPGQARGVRLLCLRCPSLPDAAYLNLARRVVRQLGPGVAVLLHNRPRLVGAAAAAGVHLSAGGLREYPEGAPAGYLAASCHNPAELELARARGADFVVLGPVQPTASHPAATHLGWQPWAAMVADAGLPVYALGGMTARHARVARHWGGQGAAVLSALWGRPGDRGPRL